MTADYNLIAVQKFIYECITDLPSFYFRLKINLSRHYDYTRQQAATYDQTVNNLLQTADINRQVGDVIFELAVYWLDVLRGNPQVLIDYEMGPQLVLFFNELVTSGKKTKAEQVRAVLDRLGTPIHPPDSVGVQPPDTGPYDVFINYSRQDQRVMTQVRNALGAAGLSVWVDTEGIQLGTPDWSQAIKTAIDQSRALVAIFSPDACKSEWVNEELNYAKSRSKPVFPILIRGDETNAIPFGFTRAQWLDLRNATGDQVDLQRLIASIKQHLGYG